MTVVVNPFFVRFAACLDVAIVGAGISGSYAAWRLSTKGLKIGLFEMEDRVGGRIYTRRLEGGDTDGPDMNAELGALYYIPQQHQILNYTIHALNLTPSELRPQNHGHTMYFLRGLRLHHQDLLTNKVPYNLENHERNMSPELLKR